MRHDDQVIKYISKIYGTDFARDIQVLPFFWIGPDVEDNFCTSDFLNEVGYKRQLPEFLVDITNYEEIDRLLPFRSFVLMDHDIGWHRIAYIEDGYWDISIVIDAHAFKPFQEVGVPSGTIISSLMRYYPWDRNNYENQPITRADAGFAHTSRFRGNWLAEKSPPYSYFMDTCCAVDIPDGKRKIPGMPMLTFNAFLESTGKPDFLREFSGHLQRTIGYILSFFKWAESKHLVEAKPKVPSKTPKQVQTERKKPWLKTDAPHYIYLDAPQKGSTTEGGERIGTGRSLTHGYPKRAHRRTLKHKRFKNNPLYQVENAIAVRSTWVGPKTWKHNNTIYTVRADEDET